MAGTVSGPMTGLPMAGSGLALLPALAVLVLGAAAPVTSRRGVAG